jgi:hypothetical protein
MSDEGLDSPSVCVMAVQPIDGENRNSMGDRSFISMAEVKHKFI